MPETTTPMCCGQVYQKTGRWGRYTGCSRKGAVERDGKHYCRTHDPEAVKARDQASRDRWRRESAIRNAGYDIAAQRNEIVNLTRKAARQEASIDDLFAAVDRLEKAEEAKRKLENGDG